MEMSVSSWRAGLCVSLALAAHVVVAQVKYKVTDMGPFQPLRISQSGMAAGGSPGYSWDQEHGLTQIPGFGYPSDVFAQDVSAQGQVVGWSIGYDFQTHAYVWDRAGGTRRFADFGKYSWGNDVQSKAYGMNDRGQIVGEYDKGEDGMYEYSYLFTPGQGWTELPRLYSDKSVRALQINNAGQIIGYSADDHSGTPILWQPDGTIVELGHLLNQRQNFLGDINDSGYICGGSNGPLNNIGYFRKPDGTYVPIWNPYNPVKATHAYGLNNSNFVVGQLYDGVDQQGFIWTVNGGAIGLNSLLDDSASGWDVLSGMSINDAGMIVGQGRYKGGPYRGILLTPVPEPTTFLALIPPTLLLMRRHSTRLRK